MKHPLTSPVLSRCSVSDLVTVSRRLAAVTGVSVLSIIALSLVMMVMSIFVPVTSDKKRPLSLLILPRCFASGSVSVAQTIFGQHGRSGLSRSDSASDFFTLVIIIFCLQLLLET